MRRACLILLGLIGASSASAAMPWWSGAQFGLCYELTTAERGVALGAQYPSLTQLRDDPSVKAAPGPLTYRVVTAINGKNINNAQDFLKVAEFAAFHDDPDEPFNVKFADAAAAVPVPPCLEGVAENGRRYVFDSWNPVLITMAMERAVRQAPLTRNLNALLVNGEIRIASDGSKDALPSNEGRVYSLFSQDQPGLVLAIDVNKDDQPAAAAFAKRTGLRYAFSTNAALSPEKERLLFYAEMPQVSLRRALRSFVTTAQQLYDGTRKEISGAAMTSSVRNGPTSDADPSLQDAQDQTAAQPQSRITPADSDAETPRELAFMSWETVLPPRNSSGYRQAIMCSVANDIAVFNAKDVGDERAQHRFTLGSQKSRIIAHNYGESFFFGKDRIESDFDAMQKAESKALSSNKPYLRSRMMECRRVGLVYAE